MYIVEIRSSSLISVEARAYVYSLKQSLLGDCRARDTSNCNDYVLYHCAYGKVEQLTTIWGVT